MFLRWNPEAMRLDDDVVETLPNLVQTGEKYLAREPSTVNLDGITEVPFALSAETTTKMMGKTGGTMAFTQQTRLPEKANG